LPQQHIKTPGDNQSGDALRRLLAEKTLACLKAIGTWTTIASSQLRATFCLYQGSIMKRTLWMLVALCTATPLGPVSAQQPTPLTADRLRGLELRGLGPTLAAGRVGDIAVDPRDHKVWYIVVASGGLWKTHDAGKSWKTIFDDQGSYSLGCITLDPKNPDVVWLGTGENQAQRSVGFGDGIYKSADGGKSWKHMGLASSEHIAKIVVDPRDSAVVYVAAQGPLWSPGGDRGLFKSTDGGKTWMVVLEISENTGVTDVVMDPRNPDVLYAASYQRRRNVGLLIGGGPESAIYKSIDRGANWSKLTSGLPTVDLGRIALGIAPEDSKVVYALVTAASKESGFFRSGDGGATWVKQSGYKVVDPQYYGKIYADPHQAERIYAVDVNIHVSEDGGKQFKPAGWKVHSDNHAIFFDPKEPEHVLVGNDGGLYETHNRGRAWHHFTNMPTMQFYRVGIDGAFPFYNVYGGAQDNGSVGGPVRTLMKDGIRNSDWGRFGGADGMQPRVDPENRNLVYTMSQNGAIVRIDDREKSTKGVSIRPKTAKDSGVRWNWDTPFIISPHAAKRLYLAGSVLFRSDDRGSTWTAISPDLTRKLDRNKQPVMGKLWGPDAVTRNLFTTELSVASALAESPKQEGLLYVGTDDGLIQVSEDGGKNWRKVDSFAGVPELTYVSALCASRHEADTVFGAFNNWQRGDFKPYVLRSADRGKSWTSMASNLPARHCIWCLIEDHVNKDLLFAGTEFGLFVTVDGGNHWVPLKGGVPVVAFRDLDMHRQASDLVCATFGRGFYVLDDIEPLRHLSGAALAKDGMLFPVRKVVRYEQRTRADTEGFTAPNPPFGALFTYYLNVDQPAGAKIVLTVTDKSGNVLKRLDGPATAGLHRVNWDLNAPEMVGAGKYRVEVTRVLGGAATPLGGIQEFEVAGW
jgi:photosystem II stability/assembly factor-like uncharacterized protein